MSLQHTDQESAAVAVAPRVTLADIEASIKLRYDLTGDEATRGWHPSLEILSICVLVMNNGFTVIGKAAPASPENFNRALGIKFAYEDAIRQLWPLMGYALREQLAAASP
jgi:hypothetical protein